MHGPAPPRHSSHRIVTLFWRALRDLGTEPAAGDVEAWALAIHGALASTARQFHSHEHVIELAEGAVVAGGLSGELDPIEVIAALYHDVIYVHVDGELPRAMAPILEPLMERVPDGWRIRDAASEQEATRDVLAVFGRRPGDVLGPLSGLNELGSALVAAVHVGAVLSRANLVSIAACIEATIPFRENPGAELARRLALLVGSAEHVTHDVQRAIRVANRDVANFAEEDPARFLANTLKLLPETNPALNVPSLTSVGDYRAALQKMQTFLASLPPERVFHSWGHEPRPAVHAARIATVRRNIAIAVRYLRAKLYAMGLVEALCVATGGDLPLQYVLGTMQRSGEKSRIESFLPPPRPIERADPVLERLLSFGGDHLAPAPLAAQLVATLGEERIVEGTRVALAWWSSELTVHEFLTRQRIDVVTSLARAAAALADTRREALLHLAARLDAVASGSAFRTLTASA